MLGQKLNFIAVVVTCVVNMSCESDLPPCKVELVRIKKHLHARMGSIMFLTNACTYAYVDGV